MLITRQTNLTAHYVQFARFLRIHKFPVGPRDVTLALEATEHIMPSSYDEFRMVLSSIFIRRELHISKFDSLFDKYWKEIERAENAKEKKVAEKKKKKVQRAPSITDLKSWLFNGRLDEEKTVAGADAAQNVLQKDFASFDKNGLQQIRKIIQIIAKKIALAESRRYHKTKKRKQIDLRKTVANATKKEGELVRLYYRKPKPKKVKIVLVCDVSRSMELYSQFLIQFMLGFQSAVQKIEAFIFSTDLHYITPLIDHQNVQESISDLSNKYLGWSGGTRIGHSLHQLVREHNNRLGSSSVFIVLSDGWETGDIELLQSSMKAIHRKVSKVIWLNPLAGQDDYVPEVAGMKAALPYIDLLAPAHNINSLARLVRKL